MSDLDLARIQREEARWRVMVALNAARPLGADSRLLWRVVCDVGLDVTENQVKAELDYLADKGLVALKGGDGRPLNAKLTAYGVDVVEYAKPCPPGIDRPKAI